MKPVPALFLLLASLAVAQEEEPAFSIAGQVLNAGGKPRAGALVSLWDAESPERFLAKGETNALGRFSVDVSPQTAAAREHPYGAVIVEVKGGGGALVRQTAHAGSMELKLATPDRKKFEGTVLTHDEKPLPAAVVIATLGDIVEKTTTDENGKFVLTQFAAMPNIRIVGEGCVVYSKSYRVVMPQVEMREYRLVDEDKRPIAGARIRDGKRDVAVTGGDGRCRVPFVADAAGVRPAKYRLHAKGYEAAWLDDGGEYVVAAAEPLRGVVVDGNGKTVPNARVSLSESVPLWPPRIRSDFVTWTDKLGGFRFDALPRGMVGLRATAPGYLPTDVRVEAGIAADRITLSLIEGLGVGGRVMRAGQPALGARIRALIGDRVVATAYSDHKGRFLMNGIPPGATHLRADEPGRRSVRTAIKDGVTLDLEDRMRLSGHLVSDSGEPLAGLKVGMWREGTMEKRRETTTDERGRFDFGVVPVVPFALAGVPKDHETLHRVIMPGEAQRIVVRSRYGQNRLQVMPAIDRGVRMHVELRRLEAPHVTQGGVAEFGNYSFANLPPGKYRITIRAEGYLDYTEELQMDRSMTLRPELKRGGTLEVVASKGAKVIVQTLSGKPAPIVVMSLAAGEKRLRGFGPGEYRFISRAKGELIVVRLVKLGPNAKPQELDLRGGKESEMPVHVLDRAGEKVVGARVTIEIAGFVAPPRRTDENGAVTLTRLFQGRVTVRASLGEREALEDVVVEPGKQISVRLTLGD